MNPPISTSHHSMKTPENALPWLGVVTAGGSSQRFHRGGGGSSTPSKVLVELNGISILQRACAILLEASGCEGLVITAPKGVLAEFIPVQQALEQQFRGVPIHLIAGGENRRASVLKGLQALEALGHSDTFQGNSNTSTHRFVVVHDGARPLLTKGWLDEALHTLAADETLQGLIAAAPVSDTLKRVEPTTLHITETTDRSTLWAVQTPQVFQAKALWYAHHHAPAELNATDDAQLLEVAYASQAKVQVYPCATSNIKITTPEDVTLATAILACRQQA
jgi:2-C-methyl-D-erythritol 4-phosphate cytidylyltransferase